MTEHRLANFPAIATAYAGFNFRSRLEAKYAVFFDLCKWPWTYEPETEFNGWIPDFAIGAFPTFVEVKPFYRLGEWQDQVAKIKASGCTKDVLLFGADPVFIAQASGAKFEDIVYREDQAPKFGGVLTAGGHCEEYGQDVRPVCFGVDWQGGVKITVCDWGEWKDFSRGYITGSACEVGGEWEDNMEKLRALWSQACNVVQWMPKVNKQ